MRFFFIILGFSVIFLQASCFAGDFIVEYVRENYREEKIPLSHDLKIYHSIQVTSKAGPKLLILKGDDYHYRTWLRHYIARGKQFIIQIPDNQDDLFISSTAFDMSVTDLHPVNLDRFRQKDENLSGLPSTPQSSGVEIQDNVENTDKITPEILSKKKQAGLKPKEKAGRPKKKVSLKRLSKES